MRYSLRNQDCFHFRALKIYSKSFKIFAVFSLKGGVSQIMEGDSNFTEWHIMV